MIVVTIFTSMNWFRIFVKIFLSSLRVSLGEKLRKGLLRGGEWSGGRRRVAWGGGAGLRRRGHGVRQGGG